MSCAVQQCLIAAGIPECTARSVQGTCTCNILERCPDPRCSQRTQCRVSQPVSAVSQSVGPSVLSVSQKRSQSVRAASRCSCCQGHYIAEVTGYAPAGNAALSICSQDGASKASTGSQTTFQAHIHYARAAPLVQPWPIWNQLWTAWVTAAALRVFACADMPWLVFSVIAHSDSASAWECFQPLVPLQRRVLERMAWLLQAVPLNKKVGHFHALRT
jgi:hypothetical protein